MGVPEPLRARAPPLRAFYRARTVPRLCCRAHIRRNGRRCPMETAETNGRSGRRFIQPPLPTSSTLCSVAGERLGAGGRTCASWTNGYTRDSCIAQRQPCLARNKQGSSRSYARSMRRHIGLGTGVLSLVIILALLASNIALLDDQEQTYQQLATLVDTPAGHPREKMSELPRACIAWLTVAGTTISYPIAHPSSSEPDYYLDHSLWDAASSVGCPYLDARSDPDGTHLMVFGHHLAHSTVMLSELADSYQQVHFDTIGTATWQPIADGTQSGKARSFEPLCALEVPATFTPIQRVTFASRAALHDWLEELVARASARANTWRQRLEQADYVLSLITCTEGNGRSKQRTITVFVAQAGE